MRLINTTSHTLHEFFGDEIPDYAILSHRWENEEVTLQDLQSGMMSEMAGFAKIKGCCGQAVRDGWEFAWIDSCCIDKTSSAELSEAINSMFKWYQNAQVCYAYLSDVPSGAARHIRKPNSAFCRSKWFTRGWTLQELLAPELLVFFDQEWVDIGTKYSLRDVVSSVTGIGDLVYYQSACIAQKMSWASRREATRVEDKAYSLMGLFGVNMPPLYGEGEKAFLRLQLEIIKTSDDESIFAWEEEGSSDLLNTSGLLARSLASFRESGNIQRASHGVSSTREPYSMTNKGLRLELLLTPSESLGEEVRPGVALTGELLAPLKCVRKGTTKALAIFLKRQNRDQFVRTFPDKLAMLDLSKTGINGERIKFSTELLYVRQDDESESSYSGQFGITIRTTSLHEHGFSLSKRYISHLSSNHWDHDVVDGPRITMDSDSCYAELLYTEIRPVKTHRELENIIVVITTWLGRAGIYVLLPEDTPSLDSINRVPSQLKRTGIQKQCLDRISVPLKSGKSVSVELKKERVRKPYLNRKRYVVDVSVQSDGNLRWPDPDFRWRLNRIGL